MRRANGTGGVVKRSGNRRCPYEARITVGYTEDEKQIIKAIGSYATRDEAFAALLNYNKSPYDIDNKQITFAELYEKWKERASAQGRLSKSSIACLTTGYIHCSDLYDLPYINIRPHMMQKCIDGCGRGYATQNTIRGLFRHLDQYAMEFDIIVKRCSDFLNTSTVDPKPKKIFSNSEVIKLWDNNNMPWADTILILLYSGWRISELLGLLKKNVVIDPSGKTVNYMQGGIKTKAGKDRIVPIHSAILPIVKKYYKKSETYLIEKNGKPVRYDTYVLQFRNIMKRLDMKHTIHETRHTFRTWLNRASANIAFANKLMGHKCGDVGLEVYTHKNVQELRDTIELIKSINE